MTKLKCFKRPKTALCRTRFLLRFWWRKEECADWATPSFISPSLKLHRFFSKSTLIYAPIRLIWDKIITTANNDRKAIQEQSEGRCEDKIECTWQDRLSFLLAFITHLKWFSFKPWYALQKIMVYRKWFYSTSFWLYFPSFISGLSTHFIPSSS